MRKRFDKQCSLFYFNSLRPSQQYFSNVGTDFRRPSVNFDVSRIFKRHVPGLENAICFCRLLFGFFFSK